MSADDDYEVQQDAAAGDAPTDDVSDNDYQSRTGQSQVPVQSDDKPVDDPIPDDGSADSDEALAQDDKEAIDSSNIIEGGRTRGAAPEAGTYAEPGDDEGLPGPEDGTSGGRQ